MRWEDEIKHQKYLSYLEGKEAGIAEGVEQEHQRTVEALEKVRELSDMLSKYSEKYGELD